MKTGGYMIKQRLFDKWGFLAIMFASIASLCVFPTYATDQPATTEITDQTAETVSKKLANPISDLINMPIQLSWNRGGGPKDDGQHWKLYFQPVVSGRVYGNWHVISRSQLALENKHNFGYDSRTGLGDLTQTFFVAPIDQNDGFKWGVGPAFLIPTATEKVLGAGKWAAGPSFVVSYEYGKWTPGLLFRHLWSFAGDGARDNVDLTHVQPFLTYRFSKAWSIKINSEYEYDWQDHTSSAPIDLVVSKVVNLFGSPVSFSFGGRYYLDTDSRGPDWGLRASVTFVMPHLIKRYIRNRIESIYEF